VQHRIRASRIIIVALIIALASIALVAAAIYYYYTAQVYVNVETPKVIWVTGSDITAVIGTNSTWCQITVNNLEPNATTVYTNALKFTVNTASSSNGMGLQIGTVGDSNSIIWGIRFYIFNPGASSTSLTLVDGGNATISGTDGNQPLGQVGYRQAGANSGYGSTTVPTQSSGFTGAATTTYIIAIEVKGAAGISTTWTANMQLKLLWSQ
jgi:hypothetical protein